jgi:hypothetical protein
MKLVKTPMGVEIHEPYIVSGVDINNYDLTYGKPYSTVFIDHITDFNNNLESIFNDDNKLLSYINKKYNFRYSIIVKDKFSTNKLIKK